MGTAEGQDATEQQEAEQHHPASDLGERLQDAVARETEEGEEEDSEASGEDQARSARAPSPDQGSGSAETEPLLSAEPEPAIYQEWPICPACGGRGHVPSELKQSPNYTVCPDCNGLGSTLTGSLTEEGAVLQCERCMGNGYVRNDFPPPVPQAGAEPPQGDWQQRY